VPQTERKTRARPASARAARQALMAAKARYLLAQLQQLGFAEWQCAPAVLRHGSNLQACPARPPHGVC